MKSVPNKSKVRLAIVGTGGMANIHAQRFGAISGCHLVAAVDIDLKRAQSFAKTHSIPEVYASPREMLKNAGIDAVSVATPDPYHASVTIECLKAGKHTLCEKPLALNYKDARRMVVAAKKAGVVNMVNFSYRDWSSIQKIATIVQSGEIGEIRHVEASYYQSWLISKAWGDWRTNPTWLWRLSNEHGSKGALGDIGVHILDFATFPAGPINRIYAQLKTFDKVPGNRIGEYTLDANDSAVINVEFANGALGSIQTTRWMGGHVNRLFLKISGTKGSVEFDSDRGTTSYRICAGRDLDKGAWKEVAVKATPSNYQRFIKSIRTGIQDQPDFARGAEVQRILDAGFKSHELKAPVRIFSGRI